MKPLFSIVIPIYNSYNLVDRCLNSLEGQSDKDFEVIFVDDCSTDGSYQKLKDKLKKYSFTYKVIKNKKNSGPGATRNNGINKCSGEYIIFVDSDDYLENNLIENMKKILKEKNTDIIIYDYFITYKENNKRCYSLPFENGFVKKMDALALSNGMCWGKVYKKSIIIDNNIQFPNLMRSEDLAFVKVYLSKCKKVYYDKNVYYYYIQHKKSIMHNHNTLNINNNIVAFNYIKDNAENNADIEMIFIREYLYLIVQNMILTKEKNKNIKKFIKESSEKYPNWYNNEYIKYQPKYLKILLFFIKIRFILPLRIIFKLK